jgi:hypothetical protein
MLGGFDYAVSQALNIPLTSLANSATAGAQSDAVDNSVDKYIDVLVQLKFKLVTGTPAADQIVYVYLYGSENGTNYPDGLTGVAGAYTLRAPSNLTLVQTVAAATAGQVVNTGQPFSVALAFNGILPVKWGVVVRNTTNLAFTATAGDHSVTYTGIKILNT